MTEKQIVDSKVKCPKCGSRNLTLLELWKNHDISWEQIGGKFDMKDGVLEMGDPYKMEAECSKCKHHWTIRGALQIGCIIKPLTPNTQTATHDR